MVQKVRGFLEANQMVGGDDTVLIGVSGGADSVCLLCVLHEIYRGTEVQLRAVHINHQLRGTAKRDEDFTRELCEKLQIPFQCVYVDVAACAEKYGYSTEEAARRLRYEAFGRAAEEIRGEIQNASGQMPVHPKPQDADAASACVPDAHVGHPKPQEVRIAVAHNMEDNAETMLLNLFRGTGLKGLGGIAPRRGNIIRPLLGVSRSEIEAYLEEKGITYCTDETNLTDDYTRNRIRHHILPYAENEIHPGAVRRMNETAAGILSAEDFIAQEIRKAEAKCVRAENMEREAAQSSGETAQNIKEEAQNIREPVWSAGEPEEGTSALREEPNPCGGRLILKGEFEKLHPYLQRRLVLEEICRTAESAKDIAAVHVELVLNLMQLQVGRRITLPCHVRARRVYEGVLLHKADSAGEGMAPYFPDQDAEADSPETAGDADLGCGEGVTSCFLDEDAEAGSPETVRNAAESRRYKGVRRFGIEKTPPLLLVPGEVSEHVSQSGGRLRCRVFDRKPADDIKIPADKYTKWFDCDRIGNGVWIRARRAGDFLVINSRGNHQSLQDYFVNAKIPEPERDRIVLIADGAHVMWVVGYRMSQAYYVTNQTKKVLEIVYEPGGE